MKSFEDLEVYKKAFNFSVNIFRLSKSDNINKNIVYQLERAALSISNNIAEGFELQSNKQFVKFLYIAKGSSGECRNLLAIGYAINQINEEEYNKLRDDSLDI